MRLINADELKKKIENIELSLTNKKNILNIIDIAPTVELDESVIQEVLNKRCMTAVPNEYLIALHGKRPQGEWLPNYTSQFMNPGRQCSLCGKIVEFSENYCPKCGAEMRGDKNV